MVAALVVYSIYTQIVEEKLRKKLVNYLENNEIEWFIFLKKLNKKTSQKTNKNDLFFCCNYLLNLLNK